MYLNVENSEIDFEIRRNVFFNWFRNY